MTIADESSPEAAAHEATAVTLDKGTMKRELGEAARNTLKLGLSLMITWTIALLVRFQLPRFLGPQVFGSYNFADSFAASFFAFLDFGVDVYIQKEVSVRPKHASDFFGGIVLLRAVVSVALIGAIAAILDITHRPPDIQLAGALFAVTYFVTCINSTLGAILQAARQVGRLALLNVAGKVIWGVGLGLLIWTRSPMPTLALPMLAAELMRSALLWPSVRSAVDLEVKLDLAAVKHVIVGSLPYYIGATAIGVSGKINVSLLEFLVPDRREVGWLGAAMNLGSLSMVMYPVLSWIVLPMLARARARSLDEVFVIVRGTLEGLLVVAVPVSLLIGIGADVWVRLAFGRKYDQAALALVTIAPTFVCTYTSMILSMALVVLDRQWTATRISVVALVLCPIFILIIVPITARIGEGGAAAGAAAAVFFNEIIVSGSCLYYVGRRAADRRTLSAAAKSVAIAGAVITLDRFLRPLGWRRLPLDMGAYLFVALAAGAVRVKDALRVVRLVRHREAEQSVVA